MKAQRRGASFGILCLGTGLVLDGYKPMPIGLPAGPALARVQAIEDAKKRRYGYEPPQSAWPRAHAYRDAA